MTKSIAQIIEANDPVIMRRDDWRDLPEYILPPGYSLRFYHPGDSAHWVKILRAAFGDDNISTDFFMRRFGKDERELSQRQYFLCKDSGEEIGTATAWHNNFENEYWGRVRSVAIIPEFQGKHLAPPLLSAVCQHLAQLGHERAFLSTSTNRFRAIKLYWHFGFRPHLREEKDSQVWRDLKMHLQK